MKRDYNVETRVIFDGVLIALNNWERGVGITLESKETSDSATLKLTYDNAVGLANEIIDFCERNRPSDNKCSCDEEAVKCPYCGSTDIYKGKEFKLCLDCDKTWEK